MNLIVAVEYSSAGDTLSQGQTGKDRSCWWTSQVSSPLINSPTNASDISERLPHITTRLKTNKQTQIRSSSHNCCLRAAPPPPHIRLQWTPAGLLDRQRAVRGWRPQPSTAWRVLVDSGEAGALYNLAF
ncbi:hypothetical protein E2C01_057621 [Portunus trituberculatus]|uniref:Uncharacterized protein n=1 Tax=Portunus trituberculatus TaxID=210409 RepID=A0A5B7H0I4_PORTR|nr:hypothetical protein [Portunus trituberculatus]